jgi:hypothetical protein
MTWNDCLALGPTRLAQLIGCPITTAHSWMRRSGPPEWQREIFRQWVEAAMRAEARKK